MRVDDPAAAMATFVRANTFPQLRGSLLFAGLRSTTLWQLTMGGATPQLVRLGRDLAASGPAELS